MEHSSLRPDDKAGLWEKVVRYIILGGALVMVSVMASQGGHPLPTGTKAPPLALMGLDGQPVDLTPYRGRPTLLNFWATWCTPCLREIPELNKAHQEMSKDVNIVGVLVFSGGLEEARATVQRMKIDYPVWLSDDVSAQRWQVSAVPTSFLVDEGGSVRWATNGTIDEDDIRDALESMRQAK